jgi:hypothetical protein
MLRCPGLTTWSAVPWTTSVDWVMRWCWPSGLNSIPAVVWRRQAGSNWGWVSFWAARRSAISGPRRRVRGRENASAGLGNCWARRRPAGRLLTLLRGRQVDLLAARGWRPLSAWVSAFWPLPDRTGPDGDRTLSCADGLQLTCWTLVHRLVSGRLGFEFPPPRRCCSPERSKRSSYVPSRRAASANS